MRLWHNNRKLLSLGAGALIGQGSMVFTFFLLVTTRNNLSGVITTAVGINALLIILVDWGGQIVQRQIASKDISSINLYEFAIARLPILIVVNSLIYFLPISFFGDSGVRDFLLASSVGLYFNTLNMSGLLDISHREIRHGIIAGLNYLVLASYVLFSIFWGFELKIELVGWLNGLSLSAIALLTLKWAIANRDYGRKPINLKSILHIFRQGSIICFTLVPGQIISRTISILLLTNGGQHVVATFNLMKSFSGVYTQCVVLARRAEYTKAHELIHDGADLRFKTFRTQNSSMSLGIAGIIIGGFILILCKNLLNITPQLIVAVLTHGTLWLISSSYFNHYQIASKNWVQTIHSGSTCLFIMIFLMTTTIKSASAGLILEFSFSFIIFIIIYIIDKSRKIKNKNVFVKN